EPGPRCCTTQIPTSSAVEMDIHQISREASAGVRLLRRFRSRATQSSCAGCLLKTRLLLLVFPSSTGPAEAGTSPLFETVYRCRPAQSIAPRTGGAFP